MKIETKYELGDKIQYKKHKKVTVQITCPFCNGKEEITDELGKSHFCNNCQYGIMEYETKGEELTVEGEIELIDFRNFGHETSSKIVMYRCKEDTVRANKIAQGEFDCWVDEPDIICKL